VLSLHFAHVLVAIAIITPKHDCFRLLMNAFLHKLYSSDVEMFFFSLAIYMDRFALYKK